MKQKKGQRGYGGLKARMIFLASDMCGSRTRKPHLSRAGSLRSLKTIGYLYNVMMAV
jgi:hypothetical protein